MTKLIRPLLYYCKRGVNDCAWIISRMKCIPPELRQEVSNEYERIIKPNEGYPRRKLANEYLNELAKKYRKEPECKPRARLDLDNILKNKIEGKPAEKYNSTDGLWTKKI